MGDTDIGRSVQDSDDIDLIDSTDEAPTSDLVFDLSLDLMGTASMDGRFLRLNRAWENLLGYPLEELEGQPFMDFVHPDDAQATLQKLQEQQAGALVQGFRNRYRARNGSYRWLEWQSCRARRGIIVFTARDVTHSVEMAERLRTANRRLAQVTQLTRVGGWEIDLKKDGIFWDEETKRIHEVPPDYEPDFESAVAFYPADVQDEVRRLVDEAVEKRSPWSFELPFTTATGRHLWVRANGHPIEEGGEVIRLVGAIQDITAQKAHEQTLETARADAEAANVAKSRFVANMSHEIRTPMAGVLGMLDALLCNPLSEEQQARAEIARSSAQSLLRILDDILDYSKIEAHELRIETHDFELKPLLEEVVQLLEIRAEKQQTNLQLELDPCLPRWVRTDSTRLRQVILNLIGNAVKFTLGGTVVVRARNQGARLRVEVEDNGPGIAPEVQAAIFDRFAQADDSTTRRYGGTGLGLAISKQLVELLGGFMELDSEVGRGSTFSFEIDAPTAAQPAPSSEPSPPCLGGRRLKILAAEDNRVNQMVLRNVLHRGGHQLAIVDDGQQALEAVRRGHFDLVLMDVQMPVMDGLEATRAIRALPGAAADTPIVALTASAITGDRERCLNAGMDSYASKPIVRESLEAAMLAALNRSPHKRSQ